MNENHDIDFRGKKVTVVGLARSGVGAANLLHSLGAVVTVTDSKPGSLLKEHADRLASGITQVLGSHPDDIFTNTDFLVVSPGGYNPVHFAVKKDLPVRLIFTQLGDVGCGNEDSLRTTRPDWDSSEKKP